MFVCNNMKDYKIKISILFLLISGSLMAQNPVADFSADKTRVCLRDTIIFSDNSTGNITSWLWDFGDNEVSTDQNPEHIYTSSGEYTISLTVNNLNIETKVAYINVLPAPTANFDTVLVYKKNKYSWYYIGFMSETSIIAPHDSIIYYWNFGDDSVFTNTFRSFQSSSSFYSSPFHLYYNQGNYDVFYKVTYSNGCADSITKPIQVIDQDSLFIPNIFTPDGDLINDLFIVGSNGLDEFSISIFSRWGNIVHKSDAVKQINWDGRSFDGTLVEPGVYFYIIEQKSGNKEYLPKKGFVHVLYSK